VSFLYPLFLLAGLSIAIPVFIHLFNLRRYKTVLFPNTRFLKNIQLHSRKQSQLRYKLLLTLRILFLVCLVLAFAQPFFRDRQQEDTGNRLQVVYIDNSSSLSVKKGARTLLDRSKETARARIRQAAPGTRFILLTNDRPVSYQPMEPEKALAALNNVEISAATKSAPQIMSLVQGLVQSEAAPGADVYFYSDFQRNSFPAQPQGAGLDGIRFFGVPVRTDAVSNVYIDTAFLTTPVLQSGQSNRVVVRSRLVGREPAEAPVLQLSVNGQVKSAAGISFDEKNLSTDTLSFQVNNAGWQRIMLTVNDAAVRFDDTFRITARSSASLAVLVLNQGAPNPYIQAAFRSYNGFRLDQKDLGAPADWKQYNLVVLNGITQMSQSLGKQVSAALQSGQSVAIFPGRTSDVTGLNEGLRQIADVRITGVDTATQTVSSLQAGSELVRDLFERIPENVQLPTTRWHYVIEAGLAANQQAIFSFRNGDPFLVQYTPSRGRLYLLSSGADIQSGNFSGSYFFVPFLYQMTAQAHGSDVFAITAGRQQPVFLSGREADEKNMVHVYGENLDLIPSQRPAAGGLEVFLAPAVQVPGFYSLAAPGGDTTVIALNQDRVESELGLWDLGELRNNWKGDAITWLDAASSTGLNPEGRAGAFPLWKVCVILALIMLAAETLMLAGSFRKPTVAPR